MRGGRGGGSASSGGGVPAGLNIMAPMFAGGAGNPAMTAPGMLFPPPGMPGFPGMEQLFLGGAGPIPGFHPGNYPGAGQPFFHPALGGGPPGQFGNQFRGFPSGSVGRGMGRGFGTGGRGGMMSGRIPSSKDLKRLLASRRPDKHFLRSCRLKGGVG